MDKRLQIDAVDNYAKPDKLMDYLLYAETKVTWCTYVKEINIYES